MLGDQAVHGRAVGRRAGVVDPQVEDLLAIGIKEEDVIVAPKAESSRVQEAE